MDIISFTLGITFADTLLMFLIAVLLFIRALRDNSQKDRPPD